MLQAGLRHPRAPVAVHAAEALATLPDQGAIAALVAQLDRQPPGLPTEFTGPAPTADRTDRRRVGAEWLDWWRTSSSRATRAAN